MLVLVGLSLTITVFGLLMAAYLARRSRQEDLRSLRQRLGAPDDETASLLQLDEEREESVLARLLAESGTRWTRGVFWNKVLTAASLGLVGGVLLGGAPTAILFCFFGAVGVPAWLVMVRSRRLEQCDQQFPQALQLMVLALRAGHALPGALALAAREAPRPLRDELRHAVEEHALGRAVGNVIARLATRLRGCDTAQTLSVAIAVLEQTGGNLISVIERIIDTARARTQYRARLRALTAQGRWSAWILGSMPGAFMLLAAIIDPTYAATLLAESAGHIVLLLVMVMWSLGVLWTYKMVAKEG